MDEYRKLLDRFFKTFEDNSLSDEITEARKTYFEKIGKVFEDDSFFEIRMGAFFEWFAFNRPMKNSGLPPVREFYNKNLGKVSEEERQDFEDLMSNYWSIFVVIDRSKKDCFLEDIFSGERYRVLIPENFYMPDPGNMIETRIIMHRFLL
jgi:hypothetical protein